ncbi:MAG: ribonuclease [Gammaproteobacteria bacterium]|nr:ribonuclease [Gammaproteobacteria bacterium]
MRHVVQARWWLLFGLLLCLPFVQAHSLHAPADATPSAIAISELPPEAQATMQLIRQGGPFPYPRDGVVFGNYERILPLQPRGHYHEYTVKTPGAHNRGARRIVCGVVPECYYSDDHYRSFYRITEGR